MTPERLVEIRRHWDTRCFDGGYDAIADLLDFVDTLQAQLRAADASVVKFQFRTATARIAELDAECTALTDSLRAIILWAESQNPSQEGLRVIAEAIAVVRKE